MSLRHVAVGLLVLSSLGTGCGKKVSIIRVHDTEGRLLLAKCGNTGCELRQKGGPEWPQEQPELLLKRTGALIAVCNGKKGASRVDDVRQCRALQCTDDRECPPEPGATAGHCINDLCVDPTGELGPDDSVVLCLAGKGLGVGSREQIEAHALGVNCGDPCVVPKTCRQL